MAYDIKTRLSILFIVSWIAKRSWRIREEKTIVLPVACDNSYLCQATGAQRGMQKNEVRDHIHINAVPEYSER